MASAAAAASGLRQKSSRTPSTPLLLSSSLRREHRSRRRPGPFSLLATLSFHSLTFHFPPSHSPMARYSSLTAAGPRSLLSAPASASSPAGRISTSPRRVPLEEEDGEAKEEKEEEEGEEVFDVASYNDDKYADGEEEEEEAEDVEDEGGEEEPELDGQVDDLAFECRAAQGQQLPTYASPKLSVKEKKELAAYAHSLGKKLKSQQVGKSGITPSVATAFIETLEANELLKLKVHGSCPGELPEVIKQLEESTGSVAVGRIGRSVILYRPSLSKMQKKEPQAGKKTWPPKPKVAAGGLKLQKKRPVQRLSSRCSSNSSARS